MTDHVLLVGMMGAGKTTIGRRLAARLGRVYVDSDEQVERTTGRSVREIFETEGEPAFRREETAALRAALGMTEAAVVGVAGGAVLDEANRELLGEHARVVWLRARLETLADRVRSGNHRPLLGDDPEEALRRLYEGRVELYASVADVVVDVDELEPDQVVDRIIAAL